MLKFFRRIRRKLLDEGSLRKYLVYAIGEITLVVIGILIALQINNWNIDRVNSIEEALILDGLHEEMTRYFQTLEGMQRLHAEMLSGMEAILISIEEGRWASDKWSIDAAIARTLFPPTSDLPCLGERFCRPIYSILWSFNIPCSVNNDFSTSISRRAVPPSSVLDQYSLRMASFLLS